MTLKKKRKWKIRDLFTGKSVKLEDVLPVAWIEGWDAGMEDDQAVNPYIQGDQQYDDWQAGFEAAMKD